MKVKYWIVDIECPKQTKFHYKLNIQTLGEESKIFMDFYLIYFSSNSGTSIERFSFVERCMRFSIIQPVGRTVEFDL